MLNKHLINNHNVTFFRLFVRNKKVEGLKNIISLLIEHCSFTASKLTCIQHNNTIQ